MHRAGLNIEGHNKESKTATPRSQGGGVPIKIETQDNLIIGDDCRRIMRNLCSLEMGAGNYGQSVEVIQPTFLSQEDRILFFKTKMFYQLQERKNLKEKRTEDKADGKKGVKKFAEAYPSYLSPFCDLFLATESEPGPKANRTGKALQRLGTYLDPISKGRMKMKINANVQKTGIAKFLENIRKGDQSVLGMLEEKILKTMEGSGYAALIGDKDNKKVNILLNIFPDFNLLMTDGRDEESKLNNLVSHVRTRIKTFDKLQSFFENPCYEDQTAHVFAITNNDTAEIRPEIVTIRTKQMYDLDEKKIQKLFAIFKDDYSTARTTLVADGTQPVVLNRKKQDRIKKYVEDCVDFKGTMVVPYVREMNFFFLTFPWKFDATQKRDRGESTADAVW